MFSAFAPAFGSQSFSIFLLIFSAFAPSGNKQLLARTAPGALLCLSVASIKQRTTIVSEGALAYGDVSRLTPGIVAWAAELTPGTPLR